MKIDLYTKAVLSVIAIALSVIAARPFAATPAFAGDSTGVIAEHVRAISIGICMNKKIC